MSGQLTVRKAKELENMLTVSRRLRTFFNGNQVAQERSPDLLTLNCELSAVNFFHGA